MKSPLADKIRPKSLDEVVGQEHLLSKTSLLRSIIESGNIPNMVFYGNPGTGKTTVAEIAAGCAEKTLHRLNATTASLSDIREICAETQTIFGKDGILLYIDEIQYFNKKQQQSLLEFIEDGRITLICSTTENPYFAIYPAVLSRSALFEFRPVMAFEVYKALERAVLILDREFCKDELSYEKLNIRKTALEFLSSACSGDVRKAIGALELCYYSSGGEFSEEYIKENLPSFSMTMDRYGNQHYDLLSALQKSIRGSDENAALFYLARMLEAGDLLSPCRRLLVIVSEDIGLAYSSAAATIKALVDSAIQLGLPEGRIPLSHAVVFLSTLPKSNSAYLAYEKAADDVKSGMGQNIPDYLRDSMQPSADKNTAYKYPHNYSGNYINQEYLPDDLKDRKYYIYGTNKQERMAKEYWDNLKKENK